MRSLFLTLFGNVVALWLAAWLVPGINLSSDPAQVLIVAVILGLVNAFVRPIIKLLALPLILLTLGLLTLVINAAMLLLTDQFAAGLAVNDFQAAFFGALVISVVNLLVGWGAEDG